MNDIWTTRTPALSDPAGDDEQRSVADVRRTEQDLIGNFVVCVHCRGLTEAPSTVKPTAPGKVKFVYLGSSSDVMIHWNVVEGLFGDLCLFPYPASYLACN